jgi:hypothetical protein
VVQLIDLDPIPDDVICELVMIAIRAHNNIAPLVGNHHHHYSNAEEFVQKRVHIEYDHENAEMSFLSDWVSAVPWFAYKPFKRTFRIKQHMVNTIINNLACYNTFWKKTVCSAGKESLILM